MSSNHIVVASAHLLSVPGQKSLISIGLEGGGQDESTILMYAERDQPCFDGDAEGFFAPGLNLEVVDALIYRRKGHLDRVDFSLTVRERDSSFTAKFELPEGTAGVYVFQSFGITPKVLHMGDGKSLKAKGRCPVCFQNLSLTKGNRLAKHKESLVDWKFLAYWEKVSLQKQDRRVDLAFFDENHPGPAPCSGSGFLPMELSSEGIDWRINEYQLALREAHKRISEYIAGTVSQVLIKELGPHETLDGNALHSYLIEKSAPRFDKAIEDDILRLKDLVAKIGRTITDLRQLKGRLDGVYTNGVGIIPIADWGINVVFP